MIRIIKGDITLECETQADVKLALGVFADVDVPALPSVSIPVKVNAPDWRVGGPRPDPFPDGGTTADQLPLIPGGHIEVDKPKLVAVQLASEPEIAAVQDDAPSGRMHVDMGFDVPQYIPVSAKKL